MGLWIEDRLAKEDRNWRATAESTSSSIRRYPKFHLVDFALFFFFFVIVVATPLINAQTCLPQSLFPVFLVDLKSWYSRQYDDYLIFDKPNWFVGLVWLQLLFQWLLSLINLVGILGAKPWFPTTCLIYGSSVLTSMTTILAELMSSGKAFDSPKMMYYPFFGFGMLAVLRGLMSQLGKTTTSIGKRPLVGRKKRV